MNLERTPAYQAWFDSVTPHSENGESMSNMLDDSPPIDPPDNDPPGTLYTVEVIWTDEKYVRTYDDITEVNMPLDGEGFFRLAKADAVIFVMVDAVKAIEVTEQ